MYIVVILCQLGLKVRSNQSMEGCMSVIFPHRHIITYNLLYAYVFPIKLLLTGCRPIHQY